MNKYIPCIILILCSLPLYAQEDKEMNHVPGQSILSFSPTVLLNTPNGIQLAGGIKYQIFLGKRVSIDADILISKDYFHFGPGIIGLPIALLGFTSDDEDSPLRSFLYSVAAVALSFEHLSYHIPVKSDLDISPYISLLRFKYSDLHHGTADAGFIDQQFSFATGIQVNKYYKRFVFSPYSEYNVGYEDFISRFNIGVYFGIYFF